MGLLKAEELIRDDYIIFEGSPMVVRGLHRLTNDVFCTLFIRNLAGNALHQLRIHADSLVLYCPRSCFKAITCRPQSFRVDAIDLLCPQAPSTELRLVMGDFVDILAGIATIMHCYVLNGVWYCYSTE